MFTQFSFLDFGAPELIIILLIVLLLFGGKKLPELTKSLGESVKNLREGMSSDVSTGTKKSTATKPETKEKSSEDES